jgi:ketosteroid isomerase-like protein
MPARPTSSTRSKEHHVAVGLGFWSAFKNADMDACAELLHERVEWFPNPKLDDSDRVRGRDDVRQVVTTLYERFEEGLEVLPEDGRQVGDHVLMVTMLKGRNHFTKQPVKSRECWVVSILDDKWARIVVYPNAPAARLGFEELLKMSTPSNRAPAPLAAVPPAKTIDVPPAEKIEPEPEPEPPLDTVTLVPGMENSVPTPAEVANSDTPVADAGPVSVPGLSSPTNNITLTFTFEEAEALNRWMLKPSSEGGLAADDAEVRPGLMKIRTAVETAQAISAVRHELEQAGVPTQHLSDQQVAQLGRRITQAAPRLSGSPPAA